MAEDRLDGEGDESGGREEAVMIGYIYMYISLNCYMR